MGQQKQSEPLSMRESFDIMYVFASALSLGLTVFTRCQFGTEAFGLRGLAAAVVIFVYVGSTGSQWMMIYFVAWLLALVCRRAESETAAKRGELRHTYYNGHPWLILTLMPFIKDEQTARRVEPFLCLAAGIGLCQWSFDVGRFVIFGALSILIIDRVGREIMRRRVEAIINARIEQEAVMEELKRRGFF